MSAPVTIPATREELAVLLRNCWFACEDGSPMGDWRGVADLVRSLLDAARLEGVPAPADGVQVRVAVAISASGEYSAGGGSGQTDAEMLGWAREFFDGGRTADYIITARLSPPQSPQEIAATVEPRP